MDNNKQSRLQLWLPAAILLLLPDRAAASIARAPEIPAWALLLMLIALLLVLSNSILVIVNVLLKSRKIRVYNVILSSVILLAAIVLSGTDGKMSAVFFVLMALHGLLIVLSVKRKRHE